MTSPTPVVNWIVDTNRFALAEPPQWWLKGLADFDDSLVVIPSRMGPYYRLAQRRQMTPTIKLNHELDAQPDSKMLASYGLVPVTTITFTGPPNWNPMMFEELRRRAVWRMGGLDAVMKRIEADEKAALKAKAEKISQRNDQIVDDAWKYYNFKRGVRGNLYSPKTPNRGEKPSEKKAPIIRIRKG